MDAEAPPLPPLCDAVLDRATVEQLFADLARCTDVIGAWQKSAERGYAAERPLTLDEARAAFLAGGARAVQIRYRYDGREWCDTLMRTPRGTRLVRLAYDE